MCFHGGIALYLYLKCNFLLNEIFETDTSVKTLAVSDWGYLKLPILLFTFVTYIVALVAAV